MKVCHINCNYVSTKLHQTMIEHLGRYEIDSHVFVPISDKTECIVNINRNVRAVKCFKTWHRYFFYYKQKRIFNAIVSTFEVESFDLIHAYTLFTDGNIAYQLKKRYGKPYVVAVRDTDINTFFKKRIYLRKRGVKILVNADKVFFLSKAVKNEFLAKYISQKERKILESKIHIIPNGIDDYWLENIRLTNDFDQIHSKEFRIIYAGVINKNKNIVQICKALELLRSKGWQGNLCVVGRVRDESEKSKIMAYPFVQVIQSQPKDSLRELYCQNDIFVMVSHAETFGLVYAEALTQGLPVIYTRGQGFDMQFPEGYIGYSSSDTDVEELSNKIIECYDNISSLRHNAIDSCQVFSWDKICKEYSEIYRSILDSCGE